MYRKPPLIVLSMKRIKCHQTYWYVRACNLLNQFCESKNYPGISNDLSSVSSEIDDGAVTRNYSGLTARYFSPLLIMHYDFTLG